jgi:hypothetical protein
MATTWVFKTVAGAFTTGLNPGGAFAGGGAGLNGFASLKRVPLVLAHPQNAYDVRVPPIPEVAEEQSVEERAAMVEGTHLSREIQQPRPLLQIDHGVVRLCVSGDGSEAPSELNRLLDVVVALLDSLLFVGLREDRWRQQQPAERKPGAQSASLLAPREQSRFPGVLHRRPPHGVKNTLLVFEPCIATWQNVHDWYFVD